MQMGNLEEVLVVGQGARESGLAKWWRVLTGGGAEETNNEEQWSLREQHFAKIG